MTDGKATRTSGVAMVQARRGQALHDLAAGRITATEANRIVKAAKDDPAKVEVALRAAQLTGDLRRAPVVETVVRRLPE